MMKRMAKMGVLVAAGVLLHTAGPAAADNAFPRGLANKPVSFGDCVATVAATDEGLEDHTVDVRYFVQDVGPPASHRPGLEEQFRCGTFYSPSIEHPRR